MHYATTIVLRVYELIQKNKCTFIFTKFTNYAIEDTFQGKSFSQSAPSYKETVLYSLFPYLKLQLCSLARDGGIK